MTCADGEVVWSRRPGFWRQAFAVMWRPTGARINQPQGDGGNSATLPEENTKDTVKTIRAGKAGRPASPVVQSVCIFCRARTRVPPAPGLPCALVSWARHMKQNSGETRRGNVSVRLLV
jgi:hypothetical protein